MALFDWNDKSKWLTAVDAYAASVLPHSVRSSIARDRPECWSDDFSWLPVEHGEELFLQAFAEHYQLIRAYHACRTADVSSYLTRGLLGQSPDVLTAQAQNIFGDVPEEVVFTALQHMADRNATERGAFWVLLDGLELIEQAGHYLIQGSEYLMALAAIVTDLYPQEDFRLRLRNTGIPTLFEVHLPVSYVRTAQLRSLTRLVLSEWGAMVARRPMGRSGSPCLTVRRSVEPQYIVGHTHPETIPDPHFGRARFVNERIRCSHCGG